VALLSSSALYPVTEGVFTFYGSNSSEWTLLAAAVVIVSLPVVALFIACQRQLNRASLTGSVKG
jgi:raffinose/stachyose/melibiose transport system permease protein